MDHLRSRPRQKPRKNTENSPDASCWGGSLSYRPRRSEKALEQPDRDTTYVNELDQREYAAVSGGLTGFIPGTSSSIVPLDICTVDNNRGAIQASTRKDSVKNSPSLSASQEMTPGYEAQVRNHYRP